LFYVKIHCIVLLITFYINIFCRAFIFIIKKMAKKDKYDVWLPPITVEKVDINTLQDQVVDYWHGLIQTQEGFSHTKGEGVVVFVLDTTFKTSHPDLNINILHEFAKSFTDETNEDDPQGHGIHCLGIIGAADNSIGVVGAAPNVKLVPVRVLNAQGQGTWEWIVNGIRYACDVDLGKYQGYKRIISMSLGGSSGSSLIESALKHAKEKNVYVVAAAGNSGFDGSRDTVNYPGAYDQYCITVASVSKLWKPSIFSSGGKAIDVSAFGESIYSTYKNNGYAKLSGTSMATPMVSGLLALILSKYADITITKDTLEAYLKAHAKDLEEAGEDDKTGAGVPIIPPYMSNKPDGTPNNPDDPDDPDTPDDPVPPVKPERPLSFIFRENLKISWSPTSKSNNNDIENLLMYGVAPVKEITAAAKHNKVKILEMEISLNSTEMADVEYDLFLKETLSFFSKSGFFLNPNSDLNDVAYWATFFYKMVLKEKTGKTFDVQAMLVQDAQGRKIKHYYENK